MTNRTWELALMLGAFCLLSCVAQWPNIVFAKDLSADDLGKSFGSAATMTGATAGVVAIYKTWKSFRDG